MISLTVSEKEVAFQMKKRIRIGSRTSRLAVVQTEIICRRIKMAHPDIEIEIVKMKTTGDMILDRSLASIGGKGLFVKELDAALMDGRIDLAVHSLKDMPMEESGELPILAYSMREDPRDMLIYRPGAEFFPEKGILGTSSRRRMMQMKKLYPGCSFSGIRGNVQTRLRKMEEEGYAGTILAAAGLARLGICGLPGRIFEVTEMIPAAGQGILAVQGRRDADGDWIECLRCRDSEIAAKAERQFVRTLGGGCTAPVAAFAQVAGQEIRLMGFYYNEETGESVTGSISGSTDEAQSLGERLAEQLSGN